MAGYSNWVRDNRIEFVMVQDGMKHEWHDEVQLSKIDIKGSLNNNARMEPIDEDHVLTLMCAMEAGSPIPGVVLRKQAGKTKLAVMAGNHRIDAAQKSGLSSVGAYIVTCDDRQANIFIRSDNRYNGRPQPDSEADEHIRFLHETHGLSLAEAARRLVRPPEVVQTQARANKVKVELEKLRVNTDNLGVAALLHLHQLVRDKDIFARAASMASIYGMKSEDVNDMVRQVKTQGSQTRRISLLDNWENRLKNNIPTKPKRQAPAKTRLLNMLSAKSGGLLRLLLSGSNNAPIEHINDIGFDISDAEQLLSLWEQITERMKPLLAESQSWVNQHAQHAKSKTAKRPTKRKGR